MCADWSLRDGGFGELLPNAEVVVIDEAHQLADTASNFLGITVGAKQLNDLAQDALMEYYKDATDIPALRTACEDWNMKSRICVWRSAWSLSAANGRT